MILQLSLTTLYREIQGVLSEIDLQEEGDIVDLLPQEILQDIVQDLQEDHLVHLIVMTDKEVVIKTLAFTLGIWLTPSDGLT